MGRGAGGFLIISEKFCMTPPPPPIFPWVSPSNQYIHLHDPTFPSIFYFWDAPPFSSRIFGCPPPRNHCPPPPTKNKMNGPLNSHFSTIGPNLASKHHQSTIDPNKKVQNLLLKVDTAKVSRQTNFQWIDCWLARKKYNNKKVLYMYNSKGDIVTNTSQETDFFHVPMITFPQTQYGILFFNRMFLNFGNFPASCAYKKRFLYSCLLE